MKVKRLISAALSGIMLLSSGGIIPVSAEETTQTPPELQRLTEDTRLFDINGLLYKSGRHNTAYRHRREWCGLDACRRNYA